MPDNVYAELTLAMRLGEDPGAVFDALHARGQFRLHASDADLHAAIADDLLADHARRAAQCGGSRHPRAGRRAQRRDPRPARRRRTGRRPARRPARRGQRIGVGDLVATRRNDRQPRVANRDTWTVSHCGADGALTVTNPAAGQRVAAGWTYVRAHVELAYATTAHGAQGDTVTTAHLVLGEHTRPRRRMSG